jgi:hypothetical protein
MNVFILSKNLGCSDIAILANSQISPPSLMSTSIITSALMPQAPSLIGEPFTCTQDGMFSSPDCKSYFHCMNTNTINAQKTIMNCPPGTLFSGSFCDWAANVKCNQNSVVNNAVKPTTALPQPYASFSSPQLNTPMSMAMPMMNSECNTDGIFPSLDCKSYFQCLNTNTANAQKILLSCPSGTLFSGSFCDWAANVKCNNNVGANLIAPQSSKLNSGPLTPVSESSCNLDGTFSSSDCKSYYHCVNGQKIVIPCPPRTSFDNTLKVCNWEYLVKCN